VSKSKRGAKKERGEPAEKNAPEPAGKEAGDEVPQAPPVAMSRAVTAIVLAWLVPGGGHLLLGRLPRAVFYFVWVLLTLAIGCYLHGLLPWMLHGSPLQVLKTLGAMGSGIPFFALKLVAGYHGDLSSPGFEYGGAFIVSAGLMNMLLVLDTWDIAVGRKT